MTVYVALLRGINLGGHNKVKMEHLRSLFTSLGYDRVTTYVQSGNVVFTSPTRSAATVADTITRRIAEDLGLDVTVVVRTSRELSTIVTTNPLKKSKVDPSKLHVTFLATSPAAAKAHAIAAPSGTRDQFTVVGREVYLHCPEGYGRTKLNNAFFEKQLGVAATTRNWKTVQTLTTLANEAGVP
jgi:uncharacterized protein (DUF1697 family)